MDFDPEVVREAIKERINDLSARAAADQRQAELNEVLRTGTWWAALIVLSGERGQDVSYAAAVFALRSYLNDLPEGIAEQVAAFLMMDTVFRIAKFEHDCDIPAAIAAIVQPESMLNVEKFVATDGRTCSFCGADEGWGDHECQDDEPK